MILLLGTHKAVHSQGQDLVTPRAPDYWKPGDFKAELQLKQLNAFLKYKYRCYFTCQRVSVYVHPVLRYTQPRQTPEAGWQPDFL